MPRKPRFIAVEEAQKRGPYDEYPMLPTGIDPQLHLSHNDVRQPFWLICEHDNVLINVAGKGKVEFISGPVRYHTMGPGDFVYVPGGTPHRIDPSSPCVHLRYKAEHAGLEGVAWYCEKCAAELHREVWDTAEELPQEGYIRATRAFNQNAKQRTCRCGAVHPEVDLAPYRWADVATELRKDMAAEAAKQTARSPA